MAESNKPGLIALRDHRDQTIDLLTERFAEGVLEMEEFEERVDLAHQATSLVALDELVSDLEPFEAKTEALAVRTDVGGALAVSRPKSKRVVAIIGGVDRKGAWAVPETLKVTTVMGGAQLDFREALLPPGVTEVKVFAMMGGVDIIVPPHVAVESDGVAIMGGFEDMHRSPPDPDPQTTLLRISGYAIMGGVEIETRLVGESRRQAKRRQRKERKQLRRERRRLGKPQKRLPKARRELPESSDPSDGG